MFIYNSLKPDSPPQTESACGAWWWPWCRWSPRRWWCHFCSCLFVQMLGGHAPAAAPAAKHTEGERGGHAVSWQKKRGVCSRSEEHHVTSQRWNGSLEEESIMISVSDRCESHQMWQCQTPAFVIITVSPETNGNHVLRSLIPEPEPSGWWDDRQVCPQQDDSTWQPCNQKGMQGEVDPGSVSAVKAHRA